MTETKCGACGMGRLRAEVLPEYSETIGGLPVVIKNAVIREYCNECGDETFEMPDSQNLYKAIAMVRSLIPVQLSGEEVRFIRKALGMNGRQFAAAMDVSPEMISRWENGCPGTGSVTEKLLRHNACALLHKAVPTLRYDHAEIAHMQILRSDMVGIDSVVFERIAQRGIGSGSDLRGWDRVQAA